jgi:hypothetical protein
MGVIPRTFHLAGHIAARFHFYEKPTIRPLILLIVTRRERDSTLAYGFTLSRERRESQLANNRNRHVPLVGRSFLLDRPSGESSSLE